MGPHPDHFNDTVLLERLIDKAMLDIDPVGIGARAMLTVWNDGSSAHVIPYLNRPRNGGNSRGAKRKNE